VTVWLRTAATGVSATITPLPRQRRHTLHFLSGLRSFAPVFLDTDIDMTAVLEHREAARRDGRRYSLVNYVLYATARVLVAHPEANAAIAGRLRPRLAHYRSAWGKLAFDRTLDGHRVVLTAVLPDLDRVDLDETQRRIDRCRDGDLATLTEFAGALATHRIPVPAGRALVRAALRSLCRRPALMGTFAVSSLGHRPVDGFHSMGGTTITLGLGRVADRPTVRDGRVAIAPIMRLSLTFDHRVIDGAEAADVLCDVKDALEHFGAATTPGRTVTPMTLVTAPDDREASG
jgi:pyruvate/2-oxoglutarate dehydrogenase complex dihydrolipoamide acyltransferase (E2) component